MLNDTNPGTSDTCLSDLTFDKWRAEELTTEELAACTQHLQSCDQCQARQLDLSQQANDFLSRFPELSDDSAAPPPQSQTAVAQLSVTRARKERNAKTWTMAATGLAMAAAFVLWLKSPVSPGDMMPVPSASNTTRSKGQSKLGFFIKRDGKVTLGGDPASVQPNDQIRFSVSTNKAQHFAILSKDAKGVVSIYHPQTRTSAEVGVVKKAPLQTSIVLDATLGEERVWGVFCDQPFSSDTLSRSLEKSDTLVAPPGCTLDALFWNKVLAQ